MKSVTKRINEQSHPSMYGEEVYAAYEQHRYETIQDSQRSVKMNTSAEMTEEEAAAEQQRMFTEDRARMNGGPCLFTCRATCDMRHATDRRSQVVVRFAVA
ncbi:hypothetical protein Bca101_000361 [Brassica carinata]